MMPIALENGIGIDEFERSTFREVEYMIKAAQNKHQRDFKSNVMLQYQMVDLIAASVGRLMDGKVKYPAVYEIYPTLFEDELMISVKEEQQRLENERITAQWKAYAAGYNATVKPKTEGEK